MDHPSFTHINLKPLTGVELVCFVCKRITRIDTTGKTGEQIDGIIKSYICPCQKNKEMGVCIKFIKNCSKEQLDELIEIIRKELINRIVKKTRGD